MDPYLAQVNAMVSPIHGVVCLGSCLFLSVHLITSAIVCHRQVDLPERVMGEQPFGPLTLLKDVTFYSSIYCMYYMIFY